MAKRPSKGKIAAPPLKGDTRDAALAFQYTRSAKPIDSRSIQMGPYKLTIEGNRFAVEREDRQPLKSQFLEMVLVENPDGLALAQAALELAHIENTQFNTARPSV
jgi:hypothetical protein